MSSSWRLHLRDHTGNTLRSAQTWADPLEASHWLQSYRDNPETFAFLDEEDNIVSGKEIDIEAGITVEPLQEGAS